MVRETRHLWVGNLPENIREDRIREHFKRYGRVQSVKLLPRGTKEETGEVTMACTVAFMDIKSASKAHNTEHKVDDRTLTTEYYEPAAIPSSASPQTSPYSTSPRFPNGHSSSDEHPAFTDRFYDRGGPTANRVPPDGEFIRRPSGFHHDASRSRATGRAGGFRNGPYLDRSHRTPSSSLNNAWAPYDNASGAGQGANARYAVSSGQNDATYAAGQAPQASENADRRGAEPAAKKKTKNGDDSRSPSPTGSASSRSPSRSRSRSSSTSSSSSSNTSCSISSKPRRGPNHVEDRRPTAICVKNLPLRSSDTSLKDGLYHEYKKHGKVTSVKVVGQNADRYAIVHFKKPEDVEKALEVSYDKLFFGSKIDVAAYQGHDNVDDNELRPYEAEIDEFHPKATRTLFVGNLEKDVTASDLRKHFDQFGEIIEIDIKNQGNVSLYAFCQYTDIVSVVRAIRKMDGEHLGNNRVKLGFGKSMPINCVWVDGVSENVTEKYLRLQFEPFGPISKVCVDRERGQALIFYEQIVGAQTAISKMRGYTLKGSKVQVDFASRECQQSFYEHLEKQGLNAEERRETERRDSSSRSFDSSSRFASNHESPSQLDILESRSMQSVCATEHGTVPFAPPDIRNLQKERVHLLEQLEDCPSSGDEHISPKKRLKLDILDNSIGSDVIIEANRDHRKVMEVRRLSDVSLKHHSRRSSIDNKHGRDAAGHERYIPHAVCKRRKTGGSDSGSRVHHYDHSGSESAGGSRPGTPLFDERPEMFPLSEPRRIPRDRDGPLTLPLPKFASQMIGQRGNVSIAGIKGQKDIIQTCAPTVTSPRITNLRPSSPLPVPPPASPPRPSSMSDSNSSDTDPSSPSLDERIKSLDEKYEKWSGSRALSAAGGDALAKLDATREKFRLKLRLFDFDIKEVQPSEIVKSVMAKRSVFDEDLKRLENVGEKYEPKEHINSLPRSTSCSTSLASASPLMPVTAVKITSPNLQIPKTPTMLSPRTSVTGSSMIPAKGLQYPFPSHPPVSTAPLLVQTQTAPCATVASPSQTQSSSATSVRVSTSLGDTRLKLTCANVSGDNNRLSSGKFSVNRTTVPPVVLNNTTTPIKICDKNSGSSENNALDQKNSRKNCEKIPYRRDSTNSSPGGEIKSRRNSDISLRGWTDDVEKSGDSACDKVDKLRLEQEKERLEKERLEKEKLEKERLEKERFEKEKLEKERIEKERAEKEKLEKERLEKERLEKERLEKEKLDKEKKERELIEKQRREEEERQEQERKRLEHEKRKQEQEKLEKERIERERQLAYERELRQKEEKERMEMERRHQEEQKLRETAEKERELKEKQAEEERQIKKEKHSLERPEKKLEERKRKEDNHDKRRDDYIRHRENHSEIKHNKDNYYYEKHNNERHNNKSLSKDKEEKEKAIHEIFKRESHCEKSSFDKSRQNSDNIKENRDNNLFERSLFESRHLSLDLDKNKYDKDLMKKKERHNSLNIGSKRRLSAHDLETSDESKKAKIEHKHLIERRESKDSTRSEEKIKVKTKNNLKLIDDKLKNDKQLFFKDGERRDKDKDREERHRNKVKLEKQKSKSKSREKETGDSPTILRELSDKDFLATLELRSKEEVDIERHKELRKEFREKKKSECLEGDDKRYEKRDKPCEKHKFKDDMLNKNPELCKLKKDKPRKLTQNSSDNTDSDEPKKHSIFDIVDDEPAYISMYDKVKARSCKNMQKQEEEKRQEKIKAKFSQLKQSRAKREEKKRSTSWDEDSDSDRERYYKNENKPKRSSKMLITSSDDEYLEISMKSHKKKDIYSDSDSDMHKMIETSDEDIIKHKLKKKNMDFHQQTIKTEIKSELFSDNENFSDSSKYYKPKDSFEKPIKTETPDEPNNDLDIKPPSFEIKQEKVNNRHSFGENSSADESFEIKKEKSKKHKKKQRRLKHSISSEDSLRLESNESLNYEMKHHDKRKQHSKKDKKRDRSKDRDKSKKCKKSKSEFKSDIKREGKMENIFGSLSDSSDNVHKDVEKDFMDSCNEEHFNRYSDSDNEKIQMEESIRSEHKKKKDKKRKEKRKTIDEFNESSMDFADMGKQLEANIKDDTNDAITPEKSDENNGENVFRYYDNFQEHKKEDRKEGREKKKKRKKSKEERQKHHHHDKSKSKSEKVSTEEPPVPSVLETPPVVDENKTQNQSLPSLLDIPSPPHNKSTSSLDISISPIRREALISPLDQTPTKKPEFLPRYSTDLDEKLHENAVKSISESEFETKPELSTNDDKNDELEEKPRVVISQEETEDAVAALLGESFSNELRYSTDEINTSNDQSSGLVDESNVQDDEEMRKAVQSLEASDIDLKPDTPQSEHELQIDTDTEETDDISVRFDQPPKTPELAELSQPPKTPEIPNYFRNYDKPTSIIIKSTTNIGSPPSLTPIKPHTSSVPRLTIPETEVSKPAVSKADEVINKPITTTQSVTTSVITSNPVKNLCNPTVLKLADKVYTPLTVISKPEINPITVVRPADVPKTSIPIIQVQTSTHNLPARSPVPPKSPCASQEVQLSPKLTPVSSLPKIRVPITPIVVAKAKQATMINLPQAKVAFTELPKLEPMSINEPKAKMIFQNNSNVETFTSSPRMVVPVGRGLLVTARPGQYYNVPAQHVTFNPTSSSGTISTSSASLSQISTNIVQVQPSTIVMASPKVSTNIISSSKPFISLKPDTPPSLVSLSTTVKESTVVTTTAQISKPLPTEQKVPVICKPIEENKELPNETPEKPTIAIAQNEPLKEKPSEDTKTDLTALEKVTEELNISLKQEEKPKDDNLKLNDSKSPIEKEESIEPPQIIETEVQQQKPVITELKEPLTLVKEEGEMKIEENIPETKSEPTDVVEEKEKEPCQEIYETKDNIESVIKTVGVIEETIKEEPISNQIDENIPQEEPVPTPNSHIESESTEEPDKSIDEDIKSETETEEPLEENKDLNKSTNLRGKSSRGRGGRKNVKTMERSSIQTRRSKVPVKETTTPSKRGNRGAKIRTERKPSKGESDPPADVYEFRDDEENRPRLILTIKQANANANVTPAAPVAVVKEVTKEITPVAKSPAEVKEIVNNQAASNANTRKSKRLQEKDISRNTVDDTIEDVVKNTVITRSGQTPRRSGRQATVSRSSPELQKKLPRGQRKTIVKKTNDESDTAEMLADEKDKIKQDQPAEDLTVTKPSLPTHEAQIIPIQKVLEKPVNAVLPQKEVNEKPLGLKAAVLKRIKAGEKGQEPTALIDPVTGLLTPMRECEEGKYIPVPGEKQLPKQISPTVTMAAQIPSVVKPIETTQPSVITSTAPPVIQKQQQKPQSLKAHVLSSHAAQAVVTQQIPQVVKKNAIVSSAAPVQLVVEGKMPPLSQSLNVNVSMATYIPAHASPRPAVPVNSMKPIMTVKQPMSSPSQMYMLSQQQKILQSSKPQQIITAKNMVASPNPTIGKVQQPIIKQMPLGKVKPVGNPSHSMHQLTGAMASPPLAKSAGPPVITGAHRLVPGKIPIDPPNVDVPNMASLMPVRNLPNLSPQGRHLTQSGMPVPGYEASLAEVIPHFPGSVALRPPHDLPTPHYMHPPHVMYQQYFRQNQYHFPRSPIVPGGLEKSADGREGEEAPITSPPLELRIPNSAGLSLASRGAAVPSSLHSPHDRATESPQIGQVYNNLHTARMQHYNPRYYDSEPPPAHRPVTSHSSLAALGNDRPPLPHVLATPDRPLSSHSSHSLTSTHVGLGTPERPASSHLTPDRLIAERPISGHQLGLGAGLGAAGNLMGAVARHIGVDATSSRGLQAATPPHASQVPPQAESLFMLLKQYPRMWQGLLALKNDQAAVQMYFVSGNENVAKCSLPKNSDGSTPPLRIFQRMRLEPAQVEGVARKMQMEKEHCMLLALPCGCDHMDVLKQSTNLSNGFITYLQQKQAAGIINVAAPGTTQPPAYVVHIFPSCDFVNDNLRRIAPSLLERVADIAHLLIVITTV